MKQFDAQIDGNPVTQKGVNKQYFVHYKISPHVHISLDEIQTREQIITCMPAAIVGRQPRHQCSPTVRSGIAVETFPMKITSRLPEIAFQVSAGVLFTLAPRKTFTGVCPFSIPSSGHPSNTICHCKCVQQRSQFTLIKIAVNLFLLILRIFGNNSHCPDSSPLPWITSG